MLPPPPPRKISVFSSTFPKAADFLKVFLPCLSMYELILQKTYLSYSLAQVQFIRENLPF